MRTVIISTFGEKPKTKTAWRAMGLGLAAICAGPILGTFAGFVRPIIDDAIGESIGAAVGFGAGILILSLSVSAEGAGVRALRKGEPSWVLWVGFVPAMLAAVFWVLMIIGEFVFTH